MSDKETIGKVIEIMCRDQSLPDAIKNIAIALAETQVVVDDILDQIEVIKTSLEDDDE